MAIGTVTKVSADSSKSAVFYDEVSFDGDDDYSTGGTTGFQASMRAALGVEAREILGVLDLDCGGYVPVYDKENDTLKVYEAGADGAPLDEVGAAADLSSTTFKLLVLSR